MEKEKINTKRLIIVAVLLITALLSIFVVSKITTDPKFHAKSIKSLDDKKITVMELTAATAVTSTAIAAMPSDATTPLANQIMELSSYLLIVIGAIFLEKIMLTLTGYVSFTFLIPIACLLYGIYLYAKKDVLKNLAIKLALFGIILFVVVPISVKASDLIENTYSQTIEDAKNTDIEVEKETKSSKDDEKGLSGFVSNVKESISNIGDNVSKWIDKGKEALSRFIDAIAILLITSCLIPIGVLIFILWIVKIIFGISIPVPNLKKKKVEVTPNNGASNN